MPDVAPPKSPLPVPEPTPQLGPRPFFFRHAYAQLRLPVWRFLGGDAHWGVRWGLWPIRALTAALDLPLRWLAALLDILVSEKGYAVVAVYLAIFGLIDTKSTQEGTQASSERAVFTTLATSGKPADFVAAMKTFDPVQTMRATVHPDLFRFWTWGRTSQPNMQSMHDWAKARLWTCEPRDCSWLSDVRLDMDDADLRGADLSDAGLSRADLSGANLVRAVLRGVHLDGALLVGTDLHNADLSHADLSHAHLFRAILRGAHLSDAVLRDADLRGAEYDYATQFPAGFDPQAAGMIDTTVKR
jgi:uncharacterized protein YjbI with pentapeptide repeats